ncbi:class I SAM-dependent methyltransferase [Dactylosporangium roseum]|uniref:Class I SAM-dependent methyltransferase n=1 Tax=Dactylosporangium roseum TaxID=47989 RepID=A0ABY5YYF0_9ACTN|nr:class I SAM-dependent methyltransferase [Dactylosporangium roseum]UWZ34775.1 class I SAM-dependent methyltransferase [Dactylosporangium roseum]
MSQLATAQGENARAALVERTNCRVCGGTLRTILDLGDQYLQGSFVKPGVSDPPTVRFPLELTRCAEPVEGGRDACGLVQLRHTLPGGLLYDTYWYRSRINDSMRAHLTSIAESAVAALGRSPRRVLDIGCNDGTLLENLSGADRWGIDPSNATDDAPDGITLVRDFFPSDALEEYAGSFDIVTSIAMFYDLEDPVAFARAVGRMLAPGGVWVVEVAYLPTMLETTGYDSICHEHLSYYSLSTLQRILGEAGLKIRRASLNGVNGGSICCVATRSGEGAGCADGSVPEIAGRERELRLDQDAPYEQFGDRVRAHRDELATLLRGLRAQGSTIHVYGASTKGNTLLQYCGIDHTLIKYAAERNPDKFGARTLGTNIEIISEADSRAQHPQFYLVLPWHFREEIVAREAAMLEAGCRLIFPLPAVQIVGSPDASV